MRIAPKSSNGIWDVTYRIPNVLSGKYNVHVVTLPKDFVVDGAKELPVHYTVAINYYDQAGKLQTYPCGDKYSVKSKITDLVVAEGMVFPVCQYGRDGIDVTITISGNSKPIFASKETTEMYLDYIYLEPVIE